MATRVSRLYWVAGKDGRTEISSKIENQARRAPAKLASSEGARASLDFSQNQKSRRGELFWENFDYKNSMVK